MQIKKLVLGAMLVSVFSVATACGDKTEYTTDDGTKVKVDRDLTETNVTTEKEYKR